MKRLIIIVVVIAVLVIGISFILRSCDRSINSVSTFPYQLKADQFVYPFREYRLGSDAFGKYVVITDSWDSANGTDWVYHPGDRIFYYRSYQKLSILNR